MITDNVLKYLMLNINPIIIIDIKVMIGDFVIKTLKNKRQYELQLKKHRLGRGEKFLFTKKFQNQ